MSDSSFRRDCCPAFRASISRLRVSISPGACGRAGVAVSATTPARTATQTLFPHARLRSAGIWLPPLTHLNRPLIACPPCPTISHPEHGPGAETGRWSSKVLAVGHHAITIVADPLRLSGIGQMFEHFRGTCLAGEAIHRVTLRWLGRVFDPTGAPQAGSALRAVSGDVPPRRDVGVGRQSPSDVCSHSEQREYDSGPSRVNRQVYCRVGHDPAIAGAVRPAHRARRRLLAMVRFSRRGSAPGVSGGERRVREPNRERADASGRVGVARLGGERLRDPQALLDHVAVPEPGEGLHRAQHAVERSLLPGAEERRQVEVAGAGRRGLLPAGCLLRSGGRRARPPACPSHRQLPSAARYASCQARSAPPRSPRTRAASTTRRCASQGTSPIRVAPCGPASEVAASPITTAAARTSAFTHRRFASLMPSLLAMLWRVAIGVPRPDAL